MTIITQINLKEIVTYNPVKGVFRNRITRGRAHAGRIPGTINSDGYRLIGIDGNLYSAARLAYLYMTGSWPNGVVNHINHIRDDDSWGNLRDTSMQKVGVNKSRAKNNISGHTGVCWIGKTRKWRSQIGVNGRPIPLGDFATYEEAVAVREHAEHEHGFHANHGEVTQ